MLPLKHIVLPSINNWHVPNCITFFLRRSLAKQIIKTPSRVLCIANNTVIICSKHYGSVRRIGGGYSVFRRDTPTVKVAVSEATAKWLIQLGKLQG